MEKFKTASAVAGVIGAIAAVASVVVDYTAIFSNNNNASEYRISTAGSDSPVVVGAGGDVNIGGK